MQKKHLIKIQHPFMIKTLSKMGIERTYLNIIKAMYDKSTSGIIINGQKLLAFPLRSGTRQGCLFSPLLFNIVLEVLATAIKKRKRNKRHQNWKGGSKTIFIHRCMILYIENPKVYTKELPERINESSKVAGNKFNIEMSVAFLYANNKLTEREIKKTIPFTISSK